MPVLREPKRLSIRRSNLLLRGYNRLIKRAIVDDIVRNGNILATQEGTERLVHICQRVLDSPRWPPSGEMFAFIGEHDQPMT